MRNFFFLGGGRGISLGKPSVFFLFYLNEKYMRKWTCKKMNLSLSIKRWLMVAVPLLFHGEIICRAFLLSFFFFHPRTRTDVYINQRYDDPHSCTANEIKNSCHSLFSFESRLNDQIEKFSRREIFNYIEYSPIFYFLSQCLPFGRKNTFI